MCKFYPASYFFNKYFNILKNYDKINKHKISISIYIINNIIIEIQNYY